MVRSRKEEDTGASVRSTDVWIEKERERNLKWAFMDMMSTEEK